ncbi:excalibur calcium-binding domain-containing protein [Nocardia caishijiensis]|uniref:Excalibur calcium-binding domain-containing protein n=1 Tax=Nocardia caishijiensis TaxID=184756 RepID=A0ABQ6YJK2_9NOCA|nr:excalibur calcium-binding domain-containing protein [Nocardia caishijiensis]KAF0845985.1 excalibur calcium-binding domain-containing protein [Nocardia caishijiensis]
MNVRRLTVSLAAVGLGLLGAPAAQANPLVTGSAGTGSSSFDSLLGATGSANLVQSGSAGGAFRSCEEAMAAGRAPLFRGEAGYSPHLDPDGDGLACPTQ